MINEKISKVPPSPELVLADAVGLVAVLVVGLEA